MTAFGDAEHLAQERPEVAELVPGPGVEDEDRVSRHFDRRWVYGICLTLPAGSRKP